MDGTADAFCREERSITSSRRDARFRTNSNGEQVPSVESVFGRTRRQIDGQIRETLEIPLGDRLLCGT